RHPEASPNRGGLHSGQRRLDPALGENRFQARGLRAPIPLHQRPVARSLALRPTPGRLTGCSPALGLPRIGWYNLQKKPGFVKKGVIGRGEETFGEGGGGPRGVPALIVSAAVLCGCSLASSVGSSDDSPSFASRFTSFFSGATPGVTQ